MKPSLHLTRTAIRYHRLSPTGDITALTSLALPEQPETGPIPEHNPLNSLLTSAPEFYDWMEREGIPLSQLALARQVHGNKIAYADQPGFYGQVDGLYTDQPNVSLTIRTADCAAVMVAMPDNSLVGIAHAGWRGIKSHIVSNLLNLMEEHCGEPAYNAYVALSPHIKVCCYQVGREFEHYFPGQFLIQREEHLFLDMEQALVHQITERGIPAEHILTTPFCTACSAVPLYSYRKQRTSKRLFNIITLKGG